MESIFCYIPTLLDAVPDDSEAFLKMATLSQAAFFEFLDANAHCGNLGASPFAPSLFAMHCAGGDGGCGVTYGSAKVALGRARTAKRVFEGSSDCGLVDEARFPAVLAAVLTRIYDDECSLPTAAATAAIDMLTDRSEETFLRFK